MLQVKVAIESQSELTRNEVETALTGKRLERQCFPLRNDGFFEW